MFTIILWVVFGYYLLNFSIALARFLFRWLRAVYSKNCWFDMHLAGPLVENDPYSYVFITPWFYDEPGCHFTFGFTGLGFRILFIPVLTLGNLLEEHFKEQTGWQVLYDSSRVTGHMRTVAISGTPLRGEGFSPGIDLIFFPDQEINRKTIEQFGEKAGGSRSPRRLIELARELFDPPAFVLKMDNHWTVAYRDPEKRTPVIKELFRRAAQRVIEKNGIEGTAGPADGADRFVARGQVKWWMKGSLKGNEVVMEGDGLRPGEMTSADWAIVTVPILQSEDKQS